MTAPKHEALIDLEVMLSSRLIRAWRKQWVTVKRRMVRAILDGRFEDAHDMVNELDLEPIAKKTMKLARTVGNASLLLGASRILKTSDGPIEGGGRQDALENMLTQFKITLSKNATHEIRQKAHKIISALSISENLVKEETIEKKGGKVTPVTISLGPVGSLGEEFNHLASNIHTSRLNTFGFIATALEQDISDYRVDEVMDSKTCPVCRAMDGTVFQVQQGAAHAMSLMQNDDPDSARQLAPWPSQSKGTVAKLKRMDSNQLAEAGLAMPPYHPNCRGIVTVVEGDRIQPRPDEGLTDSQTQDVASQVADHLIKNAEEAEPQVSADLKAMLEGTPAYLEGFEFRLKGKKSLIRKILKDMKDEGITMGEAANGIKDALRYTVIGMDRNYTNRVDMVIKEMKAKGYKLISYRNTWKLPGAGEFPIYQGINTNFITKEGQKIEIQFHTKKSFHVKQFINHAFYEEYRLDDTPKARKIELAAIMSANQATVPVPKGIELLTIQGELPEGVTVGPPQSLTDYPHIKEEVDKGTPKGLIPLAFAGLTEESDPDLFHALVHTARSVGVEGNALKTGSYFNPNKETVVMDTDDMDGVGDKSQRDAIVYRHEFGHAIDWVSHRLTGNLGFNSHYAKVAQDEDADVLRRAKASGGYDLFMRDSMRMSREEMDDFVSKTLAKAKIKEEDADKIMDSSTKFEFAAALETRDIDTFVRGNFGNTKKDGWMEFSDYFGGLTRNDVGRGRDLAYYEQAYYVASTENFANYVTFRAHENPTFFRAIEYLSPNATLEFDKIIEKYARSVRTSPKPPDS